MGALGAYSSVLYSHLPYANMAGQWSQDEESIQEYGIYQPLLQTLVDSDETEVNGLMTPSMYLGTFNPLDAKYEDEDDDLYEDEEFDDDDFDDDDFDDDDFDDDDFDDDDFDDDDLEEDDDLYSFKTPSTVEAPEWWVGIPQMIQLVKYHQQFLEGTQSALHVRFGAGQAGRPSLVLEYKWWN